MSGIKKIKKVEGGNKNMSSGIRYKSGFVILIYFVMTQFVGIIGVQLLAKTGWYDIQEINSKQSNNFLCIGT